MENSNAPSEEVLKKAVTELCEPVLFRQVLQDDKNEFIWKILEWNLSKFSEIFGDVKLPFRVGYNARTTGPQWDVNCAIVSMTLSEFIQNEDTFSDGKQWYYFDYKYMQEWFKDKPEVMNSFDWRRFGFDKTGYDSTLWIGSKGAHTNCHQDSYGFNLVAQIHGRKEWLLFPPSSSNFLQPTRIPYEESTVYSRFNFFCPTKHDEISILKVPHKPQLITLEPGDVLLVPAGWWHYVESLDLSISVNVWLPVATDSQARVKEAIVKLLVARIGKNISVKSRETGCTLSYCMKLVDAALKESRNQETNESPCKKTKYNILTLEDLLSQYPVHVKRLNELDSTELEDFLQRKRERYSPNSIMQLKNDYRVTSTDINNPVPPSEQLSEVVVNALCHPDVIDRVAELLLQS